MRVLMIANSLSCYGANNSLIDMIIPLQERGIQITVLLQGRGPCSRELQKRKIDFYIIPYGCSADVSVTFLEKYKRLINDFRLQKKAMEIVREKKIELIHTNASNVDFGAILSIICHIPHIWHIRELLKEDYNLTYQFPIMERLLMKRADCLIAISKYVAKTRKIQGRRSVIIYDGFNVDKYIIDKEHLFSNRVVRILYCGRVNKEKGIMDAVRAIHKIVMQGYDNFKLDIVGEKNEYFSKVVIYIRKNGLQKHICFHGHQADMRPFRENADIALMCSRNEALGRVTVESMLGECFVIGADRGGTRELIKEGETGYLYKAGDAEQLAQKILLVMQNTDQSIEIVKKAKNFALKQFDSENYAEKMKYIYKKVSGLRKR